jgi:hypothetical protein
MIYHRYNPKPAEQNASYGFVNINITEHNQELSERMHSRTINTFVKSNKCKHLLGTFCTKLGVFIHIMQTLCLRTHNLMRVFRSNRSKYL